MSSHEPSGLWSGIPYVRSKSGQRMRCRTQRSQCTYVADHFVDRNANTLGEHSIIQRTGVAVPLDALFVTDGIELVTRHARLDVLGDGVQDFPSELYRNEKDRRQLEVIQAARATIFLLGRLFAWPRSRCCLKPYYGAHPSLRSDIRLVLYEEKLD